MIQHITSINYSNFPKKETDEIFTYILIIKNKLLLFSRLYIYVYISHKINNKIQTLIYIVSLLSPFNIYHHINYITRYNSHKCIYA